MPGRTLLNSCPYCSAPMSNPRRVQCGAAECLKAYHRDRNREIQRRLRAEFAARGESYRNQWAKGRERKSNSHCVDCGGPVGHGSTQDTRCRKCCGRRLAAQARVVRRRAAYRVRAERRLAKAAEGASRGWVFAAGPCHSCGEVFTCFVTGEPAKYCSRTCSRRESKALRRARQKGADITPGQRWQVYEQDNWICRICGDPVDRDAPQGDLAEPTVDHRIPLDAGGAHAPENWQTAHRYCNSWKSNRVGVEFAEVAA